MHLMKENKDIMKNKFYKKKKGIDSLPMDAAKTAPKPIAKGPPMFKNFSLGAQTATVDRPPTIPAVYLNKHNTH